MLDQGRCQPAGVNVLGGPSRAYPPLLPSDDLRAAPQRRDVCVELLEVQLPASQLWDFLGYAEVPVHRLQRVVEQGTVRQHVCVTGLCWRVKIMLHHCQLMCQWRS